MKLWFGYSSEHSSNLVMIGRFKDSAVALEVQEIIERITDQVLAEERKGTIMIGGGTDRYPEGMLIMDPKTGQGVKVEKPTLLM